MAKPLQPAPSPRTMPHEQSTGRPADPAAVPSPLQPPGEGSPARAFLGEDAHGLGAPTGLPHPPLVHEGEAEGGRGYERRRHDALRRALDRRVASVLESLTHGFLALDAEWRITYANREAARLNGTTPESLLGRDHWETWPETRGTDLERHYRDVAATRTPRHFVQDYPALGVWHEVHAYPADDGGVAVLYRDISAERRASAERDRLAAALRQRERELSALLEHATDVIVRLDAEGRVRYANPAVRRATGRDVPEVVGRPLDALGFPAPLVAGWRRAVAHVLATGQERTLVFAAPDPDGDGERWWEARGVPEPAPEGGQASVLVIARDVTERERAARALAAKLADAQEANRAKAQFLAVMSHELRTPLNAIRGYAELLDMGMYGPVSDEQRGVLGRIRAAEQHLLALIGDVLEHARLETGRTTYALADVPLADALAEVAAVAEPLARAKGIACTWAPCDDAVVVRADPRKLRQVLMNLLSNAVKYTPAGGRVRIEVAPGADAVVLRVRDSGPGIPPEQRERVFEPFVQLGRGADGAIAGVGLGLAIAREFARGMGGDLVVDDPAAEGGATFALRLPRVGA